MKFKVYHRCEKCGLADRISEVSLDVDDFVDGYILGTCRCKPVQIVTEEGSTTVSQK